MAVLGRLRARRRRSEPDLARLYATTDASVWAEEFAKVRPEVDQDLMIGWFANAIETVRAVDAKASGDLAARLAVALIHTQEYVGDDVLPPLPGWSWYEALDAFEGEEGRAELRRRQAAYLLERAR